MYKRVFILLILAVCLLNVVGYFPVFKIKQWQIRREIEQLIQHSLPNDYLEFVAVDLDNQHELKWERAGKEFWYKGRLFDIVRSEFKNGVMYYYCIDDTKEALLHHEMRINIEKETDESDSKSSPLSNFFKKILKAYFSPCYIPDMATVYVGIERKDKFFVFDIPYYDSLYRNRIDAPPKLLV